MRRQRIWQALGWLLILTVVWFSLTPAPPEVNVESGDKIGHLLAYAALMGWWSQLRDRHGRLALAFIALGLSMEVLQSFTGYRYGDVQDMLANSAGVGIGWLITRLLPDWLVRIDRALPA